MFFKIYLKVCENKTPGTDGLSYEFYKEFWPEISDNFMESLESINATGEMSVSQRQSIIRLIPKKDKDTDYLKNWRPLTLGQTDAKIYAKRLAIMLLHAVSDLIHPNQVAYTRNRFIGEGIRTIEGIIEYIKEMNCENSLYILEKFHERLS